MISKPVLFQRKFGMLYNVHGNDSFGISRKFSQEFLGFPWKSVIFVQISTKETILGILWEFNVFFPSKIRESTKRGMLLGLGLRRPGLNDPKL